MNTIFYIAVGTAAAAVLAVGVRYLLAARRQAKAASDEVEYL